MGTRIADPVDRRRLGYGWLQNQGIPCRRWRWSLDGADVHFLVEVGHADGAWLQKLKAYTGAQALSVTGVSYR